MRGVTGWAVEDDPAEPVVGKEAVLVVHRRCYLATPASERDRLLEEATRDDEGGAGA